MNDIYKDANLPFSVTPKILPYNRELIRFSTQDKGLARLVFEMRQGKNPYNLTGVTGEVTLVMANGSRFIEEATILDPTSGTVEYILTDEQLRCVGKAKGELILKLPNQSSVAGFLFEFVIEASLKDKDLEPIEEYYFKDFIIIKEKLEGLESEVDDLTVIQVNGAKKDTEGVIHANLDSRIKAEVGKLEAKQSEVATQLSKKASQTDLVVTNQLLAQIGTKQGELTTQLADTPKQVTINTPNKVSFFGHRGASNIAPENTTPAFEHAGRLGWYGVETDLQVTSDGVWVLMHDLTVDRTTNGTGSVDNMTLAEIKALTIDTGPNVALYPNLRVPTFDEFLSVCKKYGMMPLPEIKAEVDYSSHFGSLMDTVRKHGLEDYMSFICGTNANALSLRDISKKIIIHRLSTGTDNELNFIKSLGNAIADIQNTNVTSSIVDKHHKAGIPVNAWGASNMSQILALINFGVDFITSDNYGGF